MATKSLSYTEQYKASLRKPAAAPSPKPRAKLKPTVIVEAPVVEPSSINEDIKQLFAKHGVGMPSGTRVVLSYVASFCVGAGIGYVGGIALEFLLISALTLTGSAFLAMVIYFLGVLTIFFAAWHVGGWVGGRVLAFNAKQCYQKYSSVFGFNEKEINHD